MQTKLDLDVARLKRRGYGLREHRIASRHRGPAGPVSNLRDGPVADAGHNCQRASGYPASKKAADVDDALGRQFCQRGVLAAQVNESRFPLVLRVPRETHPLKVPRSVVGLVSVDVVDGQAVRVAAAERERDKPVKPLLDALPPS